MARRLRIEMSMLASRENLATAAYLAAKGKRQRPDVVRFLEALDANLNRLSNDLLSGQYVPLPYRTLIIRDPKRRVIHAPAFRDRVVHHAIIQLAGCWLDQTLIDDSFACRLGKGAIAAVRRTQYFSQRFAWYLKTDVAAYFHSIDHELLKRMLSRRFKGVCFLRLLEQIIDSFQATPGKGLPIGALTSQFFANVYLNAADRWIVSRSDVRGYVRYMDDMVLWVNHPDEARRLRVELTGFLHDHLKLSLKHASAINSSHHGLTFCGHRIYPAIIRLTLRRRRAFRRICRTWERAFLAGRITELELQSRFSAAFALTGTANAVAWRQQHSSQHLLDEV